MGGENDHRGSVDELNFDVPSVQAHDDAFDRSPISGMDLPNFREQLRRALAGDDAVSPSILTRVDAALIQHGSEAKKRDAEWWEAIFWQMAIEENLRAIQAQIDELNRIADGYRAMADEAREKMREASDKLASIDDFITGADEIFDDKDNGKFDRDKAIRLLKARGVDIDPNEDEASILVKLKKEKEKAQQERSKWSDQYDQSKSDAERFDELERENRRKAQELIERREAIRSGHDDPEEQKRRLQQLSDEYEPDVRNKAAKLERDRKNVEETQEIDAAAQQSWDRSQTKDEEADFMAGADDLINKNGQTGGALTNGSGPPSPPVPRKVSPVTGL